MVISDPAEALNQGKAALEELIAKIGAADCERLMPEINRLRGCLEDAASAVRENHSEMRHSEAELTKIDERFQTLADSNPLLIWMTDEHGDNDYINQTYRKYLGVTLDEVRGLNWQNYLHPDDAAAYITAFQKAVQERREFHGEVRARRADGEWRWIESHEQPIFAKDGRFLGFSGNSMDITERKEVETVLREALDRANWLARLPSENPNPVARVSSEGLVLYCNRAAVDAPGLGMQEGQPAPQAILSLLENALSAGEPVEQEVCLVDREYTIIVMPFPGEHYANVYMLDITVRKQAERARELANAWLRFYTDSDLLGVVVGREDGALLEVNDYYLNLLGYTRTEYEAGLVDWRSITPPEYLPLDDEAIRQVRELGVCKAYEKEYIRKDGTRVWVYLRDALLPDGSLGAVVLDISERKRIEKSLQQALLALAKANTDLTSERNRLLSVMEALPLGLVIYDEHGGVMMANPGFEAIWGGPRPPAWSVEDYAAYEAWWADTGQPVKPAEWASALALKTGEPVMGQYIRIRRFDGTERYVLNSGAPVRDAEGRVIGATVAIMDITEQKRLEHEQVQNEMQMEIQRQLLDNREKERQQLARDLHDGPIQLISGTIFHLQVAREAIQDSLLRLELEQAALNLKGAVRELRDIMNELRPPVVIHFGLAKSARIYAEDFRERYPQIHMSMNLYDDGVTLPETMRLALFRIFQESLNNVAKHSQASRVWVRLWRTGSQVHLKIRDDGKGFEVPPDFAGQTQRGHYGLAGMKERAEAMGGTFTVTSGIGKGTTTLVVVTVNA